MRLARPLAKLRYALLIPLALAALVSTPTFAQTEVIIREAAACSCRGTASIAAGAVTG